MVSNIKHKHCALCLEVFDKYTRKDALFCSKCRGIVFKIRRGEKFKLNVLNDTITKTIRYSSGFITKN